MAPRNTNYYYYYCHYFCRSSFGLLGSHKSRVGRGYRRVSPPRLLYFRNPRVPHKHTLQQHTDAKRRRETNELRREPANSFKRAKRTSHNKLLVRAQRAKNLHQSFCAHDTTVYTCTVTPEYLEQRPEQNTHKNSLIANEGLLAVRSTRGGYKKRGLYNEPRSGVIRIDVVGRAAGEGKAGSTQKKYPAPFPPLPHTQSASTTHPRAYKIYPPTG